MSNITDDYNILRKQVSVNILDDDQLKIIFKNNKFDIVMSLLEIEKKYFNNNSYKKLEKSVKDISQLKIEELRDIVNEKDRLMEKIKANASK